MIGEPKSAATVVGIVKSRDSITATVKSSTILSNIELGKINIIHSAFPDYEGPYYVEPTTRAQILLTTNKTTRNNIVVDAMKYTERPNAYGGLTVYIGQVEG